MKFKSKEVKGVMIIELTGNVMGGPDATALNDQIHKLIDDKKKRVVVDLSDVKFINSSGLAMLIGRFLMIVPIMALAGSLFQKKTVPQSAGSFPVSGVTFTLLLIGTVLLIGALNFLPVLALGPVVEHFLMGLGKLF